MQHVVGRHQQQQPVITEIPLMSVRSHLLIPCHMHAGPLIAKLRCKCMDVKESAYMARELLQVLRLLIRGEAVQQS